MFTVRQRISGNGEYYVDMATGEIESTELHSGLTYRNTGKYAVCTDCGKRLFKIPVTMEIFKCMHLGV